MLAIAIYSSQAPDVKFTHNLRDSKTLVRFFVGVASILAILLALVCVHGHNPFVVKPITPVRLNDWR
jgi:hypothetical protein